MCTVQTDGEKKDDDVDDDHDDDPMMMKKWKKGRRRNIIFTAASLLHPYILEKRSDARVCVSIQCCMLYVVK